MGTSYISAAEDRDVSLPSPISAHGLPAVVMPPIRPRDDGASERSTGMALASMVGLAIGIAALLCLLAIISIAIRRYYRGKTKAARRAQESEGLVHIFNAVSSQDGAPGSYHRVKRSEQRESSGDVPLLADDSQQSWTSSHVRRPSRDDGGSERTESEPLYSGDVTTQQNALEHASSPPDRIFFELSTPLSSGGSTFTFAGTREALDAVPVLRSSPPPSAAPLSAATASTAAPFSAFVGYDSGPPSAVSPSTESTFSHFSALDRFPPPPVPPLPSWVTSPNKRKHGEEDELNATQVDRSNTYVIGQMLKSRAKKAREAPSRSFTGASVIERADSIKSVESLPSSDTHPTTRRRLSSLKIPYFFTPQSIQHISPTSLNDVTSPNDPPPSRAILPSIGGPRPLRKKSSTLQIVPMETLTEDLGSSRSSSSYTESSGLTSVPVLFSSSTIPGFTALMPHPDSAWPNTPATSSLPGEEPPFAPLLETGETLASPTFPLTTAFCESLPPSASASTTTAPWSILPSCDVSTSSHPPSSFTFPPSIPPPAAHSTSRSSSPDPPAEIFNTTAPLWISPAKQNRNSDRYSSDESHGDGEIGANRRDSQVSSASNDRTKLYIRTDFVPLVLPKPQPSQNPHSRPASRPSSRDRPTGRVMGARMRGVSGSSVASDSIPGLDKPLGDKTAGPSAQVFDVSGARTVPGMDAMLGRYHRVTSMQGVVVAPGQ